MMGRCLLAVVVSLISIDVESVSADDPFQGTVQNRADTSVVTRADLERPLTLWVNELSDPNEKKVQKAAQTLDRVCLILIAHYQGGLPIRYWEDEQVNLTKDDLKLAIRFRQELKGSHTDLVRLMKKAVTPAPIEDDEVNGEVAMTVLSCIALVEPDGSSLLKLHRQLPKNLDADSYIFHGLFFTTMFSAPQQEPVVPLLRQMLGQLSEESRDHIARASRSIDSGKIRGSVLGTGIGLSTVGYCMCLVSTDRTLTEMPALITLLEKKHPSVVRLTTAMLLGELRGEAVSALPALRAMLRENGSTLRTAAAVALMQIQNDQQVIQELKSLELPAKDKKELVDWAVKHVEETETLRRRLQNIPAGDWLLAHHRGQLTSPNGFYRRQTLRELAYANDSAKSLLPDIRKLLKHPEKETRRLAALAERAIERN